MDDDQYHITPEDIARMVEYLQLTSPEKATPAIAERLLQRLYVRQHMLEHFDPAAVEEELRDLEES